MRCSETKIDNSFGHVSFDVECLVLESTDMTIDRGRSLATSVARGVRLCIVVSLQCALCWGQTSVMLVLAEHLGEEYALKAVVE